MSTSLSSEIPHDIIEAILDNLRDDFPSPSRQYTAYAQRRLYHSVDLDASTSRNADRNMLLNFADFLDSFPHICNFVNALNICPIYNTVAPIAVGQLLSILRRLPAVHVLTLTQAALWPGRETYDVAELEAASATIELMNVACYSRSSLAMFLRPFTTPLTLSVCRLMQEQGCADSEGSSTPAVPQNTERARVRIPSRRGSYHLVQY